MAYKPPPADTTELGDRTRRLNSGRNSPKAGRALGDLGAAALPALEAALANTSPFVRSGAVHGLEAAAAKGVDVVDVLVRTLETDADPRVKETTCDVLKRLGKPAVERGRKALISVFESTPDERVRAAAKSALGA